MVGTRSAWKEEFSWVLTDRSESPSAGAVCMKRFSWPPDKARSILAMHAVPRQTSIARPENRFVLVSKHTPVLFLLSFFFFS